MESRHSSSPGGWVNCCTATTLLLALSWVLVALLTLIYFGVTFVGPYSRVKDWKKTGCYIIHSEYTSMEPCSCGIKCKGVFPCLKITADCTDGSIPPKVIRTQLYYSEEDMDSMKCSYYPRKCSATENANNLTVYFIKQEFAPSQRHFVQDCKFNPRNTSQITIHSSAKYHDAAYCMTMGLVALVLGFFLLFTMLYCRNKAGMGKCCGSCC